jgi:hypothetical protein
MSGKETFLFPRFHFAAGVTAMPRLRIFLLVLALLTVPRSARADAFDNYINKVLTKVPDAVGVKEMKRLTPGIIADNGQVLAHTAGALIVVKTNDGRWSKLLVQAARQKVADNSTVPILLIERFVTYKEGEERAIQVEGKNVRLFDGFQFNLDIGQVVPAGVGGDIRFFVDKGKHATETVAKAKLYLLTKPMPEAASKNSAKVEIGKTFHARYFTGDYKLFDDGRRSGTLHLKVGEKNEVTGAYYSGTDGNKYEVVGKVGTPPNSITFTIVFPRTRQTFKGYMFTGDGKAITGYSQLQERETGFYALRMEEK